MNFKNRKFKKIVSVFFTIITILYIYSNIISQEKNKNCSQIPGDINEIFKYKDLIDSIRLIDRYNNIFDLNDFYNTPLLFLFTRLDEKGLKIHINNIEILFERYIKRGMKIIIINAKNLDFKYIRREYGYQDAINIYIDTDDHLFFKTFRSYLHPSIIILNKNHKVMLSTVVWLPFEQIFKIIENKENEIF